MDEFNNNDLNEFEKKLRKAISRDERKNYQYAKEFVNKLRQENNFYELERKNKIRIFYTNLTIFVSIIVIITLGFNELIRYCHNTKIKNSTTTETPSKSMKNLYLIGLEPITHYQIIDKIKGYLDNHLRYNVKLFTAKEVSAKSYEIDKITIQDLQFDKVQWDEIGILLRNSFYEIANDTIAFPKVILIGNFPELKNNKIEKKLFTTDKDFEFLIKQQSFDLIQIVDGQATDVTQSFEDKIKQLEQKFKKEKIKNKLSYVLINFKEK